MHFKRTNNQQSNGWRKVSNLKAKRKFQYIEQEDDIILTPQHQYSDHMKNDVIFQLTKIIKCHFVKFNEEAKEGGGQGQHENQNKPSQSKRLLRSRDT